MRHRPLKTTLIYAKIDMNRLGNAVAREHTINAGTTLQASVQRYLMERRQLGFALKAPSTELMRFACFADARDHTRGR